MDNPARRVTVSVDVSCVWHISSETFIMSDDCVCSVCVAHLDHWATDSALD